MHVSVEGRGQETVWAQIKMEWHGTRSRRKTQSGMGHDAGAGHRAVCPPREADAVVWQGRLETSARPDIRALAIPLNIRSKGRHP
jgi:hypothetical protein